MRVLLSGGAGYIGSHVLVALLERSDDVLVLDNLANGFSEALERAGKLGGCAHRFLEADLCHPETFVTELHNFRPEAVVHLAGLKAVGESVETPLIYYKNNFAGTLELLAAMDQVGCKRLVFSSSATVYGVPEYLPLDEEHPISPINPYGHSKHMIEQVLHDWVRTTTDAGAISFRYFNPIGAHPSGKIGEDSRMPPNNLLPFITQVAVGAQSELMIFGNDYPTRDGTGLRDYLHISDLVSGHLCALDYLTMQEGFEAINLGSGRGTTVGELITAFEAASGIAVPHRIAPRRAGDVAACYASADKAQELLGWKTQKTIEDACRDSWHWQSQNPSGYNKAI